MNFFILLTIIVGFASTEADLDCCQSGKDVGGPIFVDKDSAEACETRESTDDCQACLIAYKVSGDDKAATFLTTCIKKKKEDILDVHKSIQSLSGGPNSCRYHIGIKDAGPLKTANKPVVICTCDNKNYCNSDVETPKEIENIMDPFKLNWEASVP